MQMTQSETVSNLINELLQMNDRTLNRRDNKKTNTEEIVESHDSPYHERTRYIKEQFSF